MLSPDLFIYCLIGFTLVMLSIAIATRKGADSDTFFAAGRKIGTVKTAFATTIGWLWADCLFSNPQVAFDYGIYGLIWFVGAAVLGFIAFAFIALRVRKEAPNVTTIPEFILMKTGNNKVTHMVMTCGNILYQLFALGLNATITGFLLNAIFGFDYLISAASIVMLVLSYSLINGLKTSTYVGVLQYFIVIVIMGIVTVTLFMGADSAALANALYGTNGAVPSLFDKNMVLALGIPVSIILFTQPLVDQMIFQRLIALKKPTRVIRSFVLTGLLCGMAVTLFASMGFLAQVLAQQGLITVTDTQLAGVQTIGYFLPEFGMLLFVISFFAIVFSTVDAGYCAISALVSIDLYKKYFKKNATDADMVRFGRLSMVGAAVIAILISLAKLKILWMLFIIGVVGGALVAPIAFAMLRPRLSGKHVTASIIVSLVVALPFSIYGNIVGDSVMVSAASVGSIVIGAIICAMGMGAKGKKA